MNHHKISTSQNGPAAYGAVLIVGAAVIWSSAGLFAKSVAADAWSIIFWRGIFAAGVMLAWLATKGVLLREIHRFRGPEVLTSLMMAAGTAAFISAFKLTSVANVALIYAGAPFFAAGIAWAWLGERPGVKVMVASVAAFAGVAVIIGGSMGGGSIGGGGIEGDALALLMTVMMAAAMVAYRRWPQMDTALPAAASSLVLVPFGFVLSAPLAASGGDIALIACFGVVFAAASIMLMAGAARLPSAEAALLSALETPLAPIWAWMILAESPAATTLIGGCVVMLAVIASRL